MLFRSASIALIAALIGAGPAAGKDATTDRRDAPSRRYTAEESAALGAMADRRAQAQQRKWDRRLNLISGSICDGC